MTRTASEDHATRTASSGTGLDDPTLRWLDKLVRVRTHPEWGIARVVRWYPPTTGRPALLRVLTPRMRAPHLVSVHDVEVVDDLQARIAA